MDNELKIVLPNGYKLVAERSTNPDFPNEIYVYIEDAGGGVAQDLTLVKYDEISKLFAIYVWGDENSEDYTEKYTVGIYEESEVD